MSLRVDLLLESEQRSASAFNVQAVLRVLSIVGPALVLLVLVLMGINFYQLKLEVDRLRNVWESLEPQKKAAEELRNHVSANLVILKELKGAARATLSWEEQLRGLMKVTPLNIQLRKLAVSQAVHRDGKTPVRTYRLNIDGKAVGPTSDRSVSTLKDHFLNEAPFADVMASARVSSYGVDTAGASPGDRAFRIDCEYQPLPFNETSGR